MQEQDNASFWVENFVPANASLRIAVVTETWPPEVNGVALTLSRLIQELSQRQIALLQGQERSCLVKTSYVLAYYFPPH